VQNIYYINNVESWIILIQVNSLSNIDNIKYLCTNMFLNTYNPKYLEWYNPYLDLEHTT